MIAGDLAGRQHCQNVDQAVQELVGLDLLVNDVAYQQPVSSLTELSEVRWLRTFDVDIHRYFR